MGQQGSSLALRVFEGDPDRPAIALHCLMGSASTWGLVARHLDGRVSLTAPDLPGHGRSAPWDEASGFDYHSHATRLVAPLITRPVDLIGHSLGATIALRIAVGAPHAIRSLTLIEPVLFAAAGGESADPAFAQTAPLLEAGDWPAAAEAFRKVWSPDLPQSRASGLGAERLAAQAQLLPATKAALYDDSARILRAGGLEGIDAPVMLIAGADTAAPIHDIHAALASRLMDVARATIPGAGHMAPITHPAEVAGLIAVNLDRA
ncbi:MAG: alpha/beta hydrolase [Paracoccus sp. (in: a-proteobacteria)]|nr:alpha/beta hydrolase [Paracoccus sp. (in: a-proteobacteria)]